MAKPAPHTRFLTLPSHLENIASNHETAVGVGIRTPRTRAQSKPSSSATSCPGGCRRGVPEAVSDDQMSAGTKREATLLHREPYPRR